jgi:serine/threonine-protein kinase
LANGDLLYARNGTVFSVPLDTRQLETRGTPVPVLEQVAYVPTGGSAQFDVSTTGELAYETGNIDTALIQWLDGSGNLEPLLDKPGNYTWPRLSPDGGRLVYRLSEGLKTDLWVYDWRRGTNTRLTTDTAIHNSPTWSLNGRYIAYQGEGGVFWIAAEGGTPRLLIQADNTPYPESFSPDGRWLAMSVPNPKLGDLDIWMAPLTGEGDMLQAGKPEVFANTKGNERNATFSADGHWLAYESSESGTYEIYVRAFSGTPAGETPKWQISNGGGDNPRWSRNGRELFYGVNDRVMAVTYTIHDGMFIATKPRVWSDRRVNTQFVLPTFDINMGTGRLAVLVPGETGNAQDQPHHVTLVLNFFDELRRIAQSAKE